MTLSSEMQQALLRGLQNEFEIVQEPFSLFADRLGLNEETVLKTISELLSDGSIRRISANFEGKALGYTSVLAGVEVRPRFLNEVAGFVSRHPGVTHNYERFHRLNLWFTLTAPSDEKIDAFLERVQSRQGVHRVLKLPVVTYFKLNVSLDPKTGQNLAESRVPGKVAPIALSELDKELIRRVQREIPLASRPFATIGEAIRWPEEKVIARLKAWKAAGVIRKMGAVLNHRKVGARANAMVVWQVPEARSDAVGRQMAAFPQVSHCYRRLTYPDWPYSHYTMIHAPSEDVLAEIIEEISEETGISHFLILKSGREFKKVGMRYFEENRPALQSPPG